MFDASEMGRRRKESRPGPLRSFVFRLVNLRDAIRCQELTDRRLIHQTAAEIDRDLVAWAAYLPTYATVDVPADGSPGAYFRGKQHIYGNLTVAQSWNNLRTMRIVINRMMITQSEDCSDRVDRVSGSSALSTIKQLSQDICMSAALSTIKELSEDICMSAATFAGSPREYLAPSFCVCVFARPKLSQISLASSTPSPSWHRSLRTPRRRADGRSSSCML